MIAAAGDMFLESIRLECSRRLGPAQAERIQLSPCRQLGDDAAAIGAARLAQQSRMTCCPAAHLVLPDA